MNKQKLFLTSAIAICSFSFCPRVIFAAAPSDVCAFGWRIGEDLSQRDFSNVNATTSAVVDANYGFGESIFLNDASALGQDYYGITNIDEWAVDFRNNNLTVRGRGICSTNSGTTNNNTWSNPTIVASAVLTDESGQPGARYCYCDLTGIKDYAGWQNVGSYWLVATEYNSETDCANSCPGYCTYATKDFSSFRTALFANAATCDNGYYCDYGKYLDATTASCETCPAGSYCNGGSFYYDGSDQGISGSCVVLNGGYTSDAGAASISDCYRQCTTNDVDHSTAVSGKYYYGDMNRCSATDCADNWIVDNTYLDLFNEYNSVSPSNSMAVSINANGFQNSSYGNDYYIPTNLEHYGISQNNTWAIEFRNFGVLTGRASCNSTVGQMLEVKNADFNTSVTGNNCWCRIDSFKEYGSGTMHNLESLWVNEWMYDSDASCGQGCSGACSNMAPIVAKRGVFFHAVMPGGAICVPGPFDVLWNPNNGENTTSNICIPGGNLDIPMSEPEKPGYRFKGWVIDED